MRPDKRVIRWDEKAGLHGMRYAPNERRTGGAERRPAVKKISTAKMKRQVAQAKKWTIGMDLGDRSSRYCVLDEHGEVIVEGSVAATQPAMEKLFGTMPRCRIAIETGCHSPWVSRQLHGFGHEVIVANPRNVR